jgi:hypothetical protein
MGAPVLTQEFDKAGELPGIKTLAAIKRQEIRAPQRCWGAALGCHIQ